jgi:transglutaminase-like putative cysteine protease
MTTMQYQVTHQTRYVYSEPVTLCHNEIRLVPRSLPGQTLITRHVGIDPRPTAYSEREDYFGNPVCYFAIDHPHSELAVTVVSRLSIDPGSAPSNRFLPIPWEEARRRLHHESDAALTAAREFVLDSPLVQTSPALADYARISFMAGRPFVDALRDLTARIYHEFTFMPGYTTVSTPLATVLGSRRGVCQDFSHLAIGCLRSLGLAARYVSGYIETLPPPGKPKLQGADVSHAWFSAHVPGAGWCDFDPTNNLVPAGQHVVTAWGRDFSDVTPIKGVIVSSGRHELFVSVDMTRMEV